MRIYKEHESIPIPEAIPELGIEAGTTGMIDSVYDEGRMLLVEISGPSAPADALIDLRVGPDGVARVVSYSRLGS